MTWLLSGAGDDGLVWQAVMPTPCGFAKRTQFGVRRLLGVKLMAWFLADAGDDGRARQAGMPTPRGFAKRTQFDVSRVPGMKLMTWTTALVLAWI